MDHRWSMRLERLATAALESSQTADEIQEEACTNRQINGNKNIGKKKSAVSFFSLRNHMKF